MILLIILAFKFSNSRVCINELFLDGWENNTLENITWSEMEKTKQTNQGKKANLHHKLATFSHRDTALEDLSAAGVWSDHQAGVCILWAFRTNSVQAVKTIHSIQSKPAPMWSPSTLIQASKCKVVIRQISFTELILVYMFGKKWIKWCQRVRVEKSSWGTKGKTHRGKSFTENISFRVNYMKLN